MLVFDIARGEDLCAHRRFAGLGRVPRRSSAQQISIEYVRLEMRKERKKGLLSRVERVGK
jgi:hypothetical protein